MSGATLTTILNALGSTIGAALLFLGGRFAVKQTRQAAAASAAVENRRVDGEEWKLIVEELKAQVERVERENTSLRGRVQQLEDREDEQREILQEHAGWDHLATETLRNVGVNLDPPPALTIRRQPRQEQS